MPVTIRLARHGRKKWPIYHMVVADSRAPRDGKYIEKLGIYRPGTNPATVEFDFDRALYWLQTGAQPSDTCRSLLSEKGVMMKKHLLEGVKKNALTPEQAEQKFQAWLQQKEAKVKADADSMVSKATAEKNKKLAAEAKVREAKAAAIAEKLAAASAKPVESTESSETTENTEAAQ